MTTQDFRDPFARRCPNDQHYCLALNGRACKTDIIVQGHYITCPLSGAHVKADSRSDALVVQMVGKG